MKRSALTRRTPLKQKTRLRPVSKTNSYRKRERDFDFMAKVRKLPCMVRIWLDIVRKGGDWMQPTKVTKCYGRVQADHEGKRAYGKKAHDNTCVPLCVQHHGERTDIKGVFYDFSAEQMREWCDWAIRRTRLEVEGM